MNESPHPVRPELVEGHARRTDRGLAESTASTSSARTGCGRPAERGFTLIEVMVSLLIFGMLAAAGVAILTFSIRAQAATGGKLDDIAALNRTVSSLSADLAQATNRATRDESGTSLPAFVGENGSGVTPMLTLVRGGWSNLDGAARPGAQKVSYALVNGAFERIAYPMLDGAAPLPAAVLLTKVRQVSLRYRLNGAWNDRWDGGGGVALPQAMELRLAREDGTEFRQLFLVGTGYAPPPPPPSDDPGLRNGT